MRDRIPTTAGRLLALLTGVALLLTVLGAPAGALEANSHSDTVAIDGLRDISWALVADAAEAVDPDVELQEEGSDVDPSGGGDLWTHHTHPVPVDRSQSILGMSEALPPTPPWNPRIEIPHAPRGPPLA